MQYSKFILPTCITAGILMIPLIAMQFTQEVQWTLFDFAVMGILVFGTGSAYQFLAGRSSRTAYKGGAIIAVVASLLLVWMNLAVGIIGSENNPINMFYLLVPVIGICGAFITKATALGMYRTLIGMAVAVALVPIVGFVVGRPSLSTPEELAGVLGVVMLNVLFVLLFTAGAFLFRTAGQFESVAT